MSLITTLIDFILHIDVHLIELVAQYGLFSYVIVFGIIFVETGLVILPFLPGDSLLFAAGAIAAQYTTGINIHILFVGCTVAAILGDSLNYEIGRFFGLPTLLKYKLIKEKHIQRTQLFFEQHGGKTIIFARFLPIIRTLAPFIAGTAKMNYWKFLSYNILGGVIRTGSLLYLGYFFGNIPSVQNNLSKVIFGIIFISFLPGIIGGIHYKLQKNNTIDK